MKQILVLIVSSFCIMLNAQNDITLPTFEGKSIVVQLSRSYGNEDLIISASDGLKETYKVYLHGELNNPVDDVKILSTIINQLDQQNFKLSFTNSAGGTGTGYMSVVWNYIFQKK